MVSVIHLAPKGTTMHNLTIDKNWLIAVVLPFSKSVGKSKKKNVLVSRKIENMYVSYKIEIDD